jgi:hypothetical protein
LKSPRTVASVPTSAMSWRVHSESASVPMKMLRTGVGAASWVAS